MIPLWMTVMSPVQSWCGMGVQVVRPAVGRPAGVGEADRGVRRPIGDRGLEVGELAGLLLDEQVAGLVDEGDPGRVVAAVLEPLEPLDQDRARLAGPGVADDSAHVAVLLRVPRQRPPGLVPSRRAADRAPAAQFSRSPARFAIASASSATSVGVRALDHDPQRRLRAGRPDEDAAARAEPRARRRGSPAGSRGSPSHWSLWRAFTARCCCGSSGIRRREVGERPAGPGHHPQDLEGRDDPVAGGRVLEHDDVAALLAAEAGARDLHPLEDVLVADRASG